MEVLKMTSEGSKWPFKKNVGARAKAMRQERVGDDLGTQE